MRWCAKAKALHVTGGSVYGYDNVEVHSADGRRLQVVRRVNETESGIVRRIFQMYADGLGLRQIAHRQNAEHVAPPSARPGWSPTGCARGSPGNSTKGSSSGTGRSALSGAVPGAEGPAQERMDDA
jgi:Recombinase